MPRPRSTITRQLTGEEEALEERASPFLSNATPAPRSFASSQDRYAWMKRDLEMRDMQARSLANESQIAGDLGDKRKIASMATKEADDDIAANRGFEMLEKKVAGGMDRRQAQREVNQALGLHLNDAFNTRAKEREDLYESPESIANRKKKEVLDGLKLDRDKFDAEVDAESIKGDEAKRRAINTFVDESKAKGLTAEHNVALGNAQKIKDVLDMDELKVRRDRWNRLGNGTENDLYELKSDFHDMGLGGVVNPEKLVKNYSGPDNDGVIRMLSNKSFLQKQLAGKDDNETKEKLADFAKTLNDLNADPPDAKEGQVAVDDWAAKRNKAATQIAQLAGKHLNEEREIIRRRDRAKSELVINKAMEVSNKETSDALKEGTAKAFEAFKLKDGDNEVSDSTKVTAMAAAGRAFLARAFTMNGGDPATYAAAKKEFDAMVNDTPGADGKIPPNYLKNADKALDETNRIMGKYAIDQRNFLVDGAPTQPAVDPAEADRAAIEAADKAAAEASGKTAQAALAATPAAAPAAPVYTEGQVVPLNDGTTATWKNGKLVKMVPKAK